MDERQLVGEQLGVKREGEVFVIEPQTWTVAYRGPISGAQAAIDAVMAGKVTTTTQVAMSEGKTVAFPEKEHAADFAKISYAKDVAPILQAKCVTCHLKGGIGPFAMDSYDVVKGFSPMIRETVRTRRMPPYFADPHIGAFKNDQGLTAEETKTIVHWVEAGRRAGRPTRSWPTTTSPPLARSLGVDVVADIPAFKIPASGLVEYKNPNVPNPSPRTPGCAPSLSSRATGTTWCRTEPERGRGPASIPASVGLPRRAQPMGDGWR